MWAGLRLLRVRDVLAQKAAWGLVLALRFSCRCCCRWRCAGKILPAGLTLAVPAHPWRAAIERCSSGEQPLRQPSPRLLHQDLQRDLHGTCTGSVLERRGRVERKIYPQPRARAHSFRDLPAQTLPADSSGILRTIQARPSIDPGVTAPAPRAASADHRPSLAWALYLSVCAVAHSSSHLRPYVRSSASGLTPSRSQSATQRICACARAAPFPRRSPSAPALFCPRATTSGTRRSSASCWPTSALTCARETFTCNCWPAYTAALFWFSPLGWWLKRKLSDLGEAISDRAGLEEAASRSVLRPDSA